MHHVEIVMQVAVHHVDALAQVLMNLSCYCPHTTTSQQSAQAYAAIVNKMEEG